jgi:lipoyl(octanoyl) transferase
MFSREETKMAFHMLGRIPLKKYLRLQQQIVQELSYASDRIQVILCEHEPAISVGRMGSHAHIRLQSDRMKAGKLNTMWVARGGGCILHRPGQLAVYPLIPMHWYQVSPGQVLRLVRQAVTEALEELSYTPLCNDMDHHIWGRTGLLGVTAMAVRRGVSCFGNYLNVDPEMRDYGYVDTVQHLPADQSRRTMSSLLAERRQVVRMSEVRSAMVQSFADTFGCRDYHMYTGHPLLRSLTVERE